MSIPAYDIRMAKLKEVESDLYKFCEKYCDAVEVQEDIRCEGCCINDAGSAIWQIRRG